MVRLIIRDDDLNFYSRIDDIESVYKDFNNIPISYAVIPMVTDVSTMGKCPETKGNLEPKWVGNNSELIEWLRMKIRNNEADVLLHGITHSYKFSNGYKLPEMVWRNEINLSDEILEQKQRLEELLDYDIKVFVAPSNKISKYGLQCVVKSGLDFSGIVPLMFERDVTIQNLLSYFKRISFRLWYRIPYPGLLYYSDHTELNAYGNLDFGSMVKMFNYCDKHDLPMAVNVHYWQLRDYKERFRGFYKFVNYAMDKGAIPTKMSSLFV